jgi:hypothetical protein
MLRPVRGEQSFAAGIAYRRQGAGASLKKLHWRFVMRWLTDLVSEGFIWGVGITRPRPGQERRAAIYITATLAAAVLGAVGVFVFLLSRI